MLELYTYNAGKGDCIRIRYGDGHNIFVDTGVMRFGQRLQEICTEIVSCGESLDLLIISHIDEDHLGGAIYLARNRNPFPFRQVWINGNDDVSGSDNSPLSTRQNRELISMLSGKNVVLSHATKGESQILDGAEINVLWPPNDVIAQVYKEESYTPLAVHSDYRRTMSALATARINKKDTRQSNRASIVFEFCYGGKRLLFTGDAHGEDIISSVSDWKYDFIKLPHHGSVGNITEAWVSLECRNYLICTDGLKHPDKQTIAKLQKWNGSITVYSPCEWWSKGFFLKEDSRENMTFIKSDGQAIVVQETVN